MNADEHDSRPSRERTLRSLWGNGSSTGLSSVAQPSVLPPSAAQAIGVARTPRMMSTPVPVSSILGAPRPGRPTSTWRSC